MLSELLDEEELKNRKAAERLENYHRWHHSILISLLLLALTAAVMWANQFTIDEVAKAGGEVITRSRVQVIQVVDGGVLKELPVREGDYVNAGDVVARLDETRTQAAVKEIYARLLALQAKATRLRAEVTGADKLVFPKAVRTDLRDQADIELALFAQRKEGLQEELRTLQIAVDLAREELNLIRDLERRGDANRSEVIRTERALNEADAKRINRRNRFLEEARTDLAKVEDEMAQSEQVLAQRQQQLEDAVLTTPVAGIVKNIRVNTLGGVLRASDELMQIVPSDDELLIEAKVNPADIARITSGLPATIRLDPFDYTIYGTVPGEVFYVSADTLKEDTRQGEEIYYRVHVKPQSNPATTTTGREVQLLPGMTAQVDIRTGERSLVDYLLKPIRKTLSESFGER